MSCQLCALLNNPDALELSESMKLTAAFMSGWVACRVAAVGQETLCEMHSSALEQVVEQAGLMGQATGMNRKTRRTSLKLVKQ